MAEAKIFKKLVTIGLVQNSVSKDLAKNLVKTVRLVGRAAKKGAQIICLQELYSTPYFPQYEKVPKDKYAEIIPGKSTQAFFQLAKKYQAVIIVPVYEKDKKGQYHNSAAVINEKGKLLPIYRKIHIPHDPGFYEKNYFKESMDGYRVYKTKFATFAVLICYDQWYPEAARQVRLQGAEIIFYPTAVADIIGYKHPNNWHDAWETIQRGHAIANSVYVAAVNRVGVEGRMKFYGQSFVSDPWGKVLKKASKNKDEVLIQKLDLEYNKFLTEGWGFLRNRRPDTYKTLITNKLVEKSKNLKNVAHYKYEKKALTGE
ncbi:MAG: carbon-nitrogen hydrolase [Candidatus Doudnabacteria bacterium]|nr:carbon-nitrogen hydrolase [Candidatus Doudnabacteria bacterium]